MIKTDRIQYQDDFFPFSGSAENPFGLGGKAHLSLVQPPWISGTADFSIVPDDQILEQHPYMQAHTIAPLSVIMNLYQTLIE